MFLHFSGHLPVLDVIFEFAFYVSDHCNRQCCQGEFDFLTHADSFDELKTFLDENWSDSVITDDVIANIKKLESECGKRKVFARERARVGLLKRV